MGSKTAAHLTSKEPLTSSECTFVLNDPPTSALIVDNHHEGGQNKLVREQRKGGVSVLSSLPIAIKNMNIPSLAFNVKTLHSVCPVSTTSQTSQAEKVICKTFSRLCSLSAQ